MARLGHAAAMHRLPLLLPEGIALRSEVTASASSSSVDRWLRRGDLILVQPGVLALPEQARTWEGRARAATLWSGGVLSHVSALPVARLLVDPPGPLHVTVPMARCPRGGSGIVVHRSYRRQTTIRRGALEALAPERSLVEAWEWAHQPRRNIRAEDDRALVRRALIDGVRTRKVRSEAVLRESARRGAHPGRRTLAELLGLIAGGCQSELEIWGVLRVLPGAPDAPAWVQQHPVHLPGGRVVHLDAAYLAAQVAVELDGAAFHGSREQRERDLRRDSALAALGWIVLRFSYARLMSDPAGCRREIIAVVRSRMAIR
jgi:hypothetical protein